MDLPVMPPVAPMLARPGADIPLGVHVCQPKWDRFRHTTRFVRWRPDRDPGSCTVGQPEEPVRFDLSEVIG